MRVKGPGGTGGTGHTHNRYVYTPHIYTYISSHSHTNVQIHISFCSSGQRVPGSPQREPGCGRPSRHSCPDFWLCCGPAVGTRLSSWSPRAQFPHVQIQDSFAHLEGPQEDSRRCRGETRSITPHPQTLPPLPDTPPLARLLTHTRTHKRGPRSAQCPCTDGRKLVRCPSWPLPSFLTPSEDKPSSRHLPEARSSF